MHASDVIIREMKIDDKTDVIEMMREFYSSPAVLSNGTEEIFLADVCACVGNCPFLEGFVFEKDGCVIGYAMISKGFSTESGKQRIFIEDLFVKEKYRRCGIGSEFFRFVDEKYKNCVIRLEAEKENQNALNMYFKIGFDILPYVQLMKNE